MDCCGKNHNHQSKEEAISQNTTSVMVKKETFKTRILLFCIAGAVVGLIVLKLMNIRISTVLPYLIFLLCPLMHVFMMKNHGDHTEVHKTKP